MAGLGACKSSFFVLFREGEIMNKMKNRSLDGNLLTVPQTAERSNLGTQTVRKIAAESGALRKIGRCIRINQKIFFEHIEQNYSE